MDDWVLMANSPSIRLFDDKRNMIRCSFSDETTMSENALETIYDISKSQLNF